MKASLILSPAAALLAGSLTPAFADDQAKIVATLGRLVVQPRVIMCRGGVTRYS